MPISQSIRRSGPDLARNIAAVGLALAISVILKALLFQPFTIPSSSMEPTLRTGDYLLVSKFSYGWSRYSFPFALPLLHGRVLGQAPRRGDVVVFKLPRDPRTDYVKRLIGLPGDRVQITRGVVYINGRPLAKTPIGPTLDPEAEFRPVMQMQEVNPEGRRYTTYQESPDHDGETTGLYRVPKGAYFFMGDNRDNSLDSRWPTAEGVGFVPAENLVGRVEIVVASWRGGAALLKPWTWVTRFDPRRLLHWVN